MTGTADRPLAGVKVIEIGHYIAGPLAAMMLADQGADLGAGGSQFVTSSQACGSVRHPLQEDRRRDRLFERRDRCWCRPVCCQTAGVRSRTTCRDDRIPAKQHSHRGSD
ncbi:CoA transferase [Bradyrhizobium sp. P5_C11_2]